MANYSLVTDSTFQPFTYEELANPIKSMEAEHEKAELAALTLQEQLSALEGIDLGTGELVSKYRNFKNNLDNVSTRLEEQGITSDISRDLQRIKKQYASDILPIIEASDKLSIANEQRSIEKSKNPGIVYNTDLPTIEEILRGQKIDQGFVDRNLIINDIANTVAKPIRGLLVNSTNGRITENQLDGIIKEINNTYGNELGRLGISGDDIIRDTYIQLQREESNYREQEAARRHQSILRERSNKEYEDIDNKNSLLQEFGLFKKNGALNSDYYEDNKDGTYKIRSGSEYKVYGAFYELYGSDFLKYINAMLHIPVDSIPTIAYTLPSLYPWNRTSSQRVLDEDWKKKSHALYTPTNNELEMIRIDPNKKENYNFYKLEGSEEIVVEPR